MEPKPTLSLGISVSQTWRNILDYSAESSMYEKLVNSQFQEMFDLFKEYTWEEQIQLVAGSHDPIWLSLLDEEQLAAYKIML